MNDKKSVRETNLKILPVLTYEQQLELLLMTLKDRSSVDEYEKFIGGYLGQIAPSIPTFSLYDYKQLIAMGYELDEVVDKTVALSADGISGYESQQNENLYWMKHRQCSMALYLCAMHAGIMLAHFSITPVLQSEAADFLQGERLETAFTVMSASDLETEKHYLYISSVVVRQVFHDSIIATRIMRQGYRVIQKYLSANPLATGYFAEAYSPSGRRLCELFSMHNLRDDFFVKSVDA